MCYAVNFDVEQAEIAVSEIRYAATVWFGWDVTLTWLEVVAVELEKVETRDN